MLRKIIRYFKHYILQLFVMIIFNDQDFYIDQNSSKNSNDENENRPKFGVILKKHIIKIS